MRYALLLVLIFFGPALSAQTVAGVDPPDNLTSTEQTVREIIAQDGIHVVRFWNPECGNSLSELQHGLYEVIENNLDVTITFVTVWNDEETGQDVLDRYLIPDRVTVLVQPDNGPSEVIGNRRYEFLGLPVTWTPSTRIYHRNGVLAYAFNYGELSPETLQQAINNTRSAWAHE
ncbi:MAG: thioredoxin [Bacteroidetes bacterium]|nr:thioredoxin [Bacteroidota bacterium]